MTDRDPYDLIVVPPEDLMGPAMLNLNERQRKFVCALAVFGGDQKGAYAWAGYDVKTDGATRACASRLAASEGVQAAIREEALRRLNSASLLAISGLIEMASPIHNDDKKTRLKALQDLADRTGFHAKTEHTITIKDDRTTAQILETIHTLALANGQDPRLLLPPIDAEFEEVSNDVVALRKNEESFE